MKIFTRLILVLLIILLPLSGCSNKEDKKDDHIRNGDEYFSAKEYKKAEIEFKNALQIDNSDITALLKIGETYMKLGQARQAFATYAKVEKLDPDNTTALVNLAKFYFLDKKVQETKKRIEKILKIEPDNIDGLFIKGQILTREKQLANAQLVFEKILTIQEDHLSALQAVALIKAREGKFDEAERFLIKAVAAAKDKAKPRAFLAQFYLSRKETDKAENQYKLAAEEQPGNADHQILLGNFYLKTKNMEKAEVAYKTALSIQPDNTRPLITLAGFYNFTGKKDQAKALYEKAVELDPGSSNTRLTLARFLYTQKEIEPAEKQVLEILSKRPKFPPARMLQSEIHIFNKDYNAALNILTNLEKEEPSSHRVQYFIGLCHIGLGDSNQGAAAVFKAVELKPDYTKARLLLAEIYSRQQSFELAINQASEVLKLNPEEYRALLIRGNAYLARRQYKEAEADYRQMININPDNPSGYYRLAYLKSGFRKFDEADLLLEKAYSLNNMLIDVFNLRIGNALAQKSFEKAHAVCRQQMESVKDNKRLLALVHNTRARVFLAGNKIEQAAAELHKSIETDPDYMVSYDTLAGIYLAQNNIEEAKNQYRAMIKKSPDIAPAYMMLATLYEAEKNYSAAEKNYRKALDINPNYTAAANNLAYHLAARTNKYDEALTLAQKIKAKFPEDPSIMDTMGYAYYKKKLYGNAVAEFLDCLKRLPNNPIVRYHLGLAYLGKGDKDLSKKELAKALEISQNFPGADNAKALLAEISKG